MLLVDAVYINDGGGKVLLDLLIEKLQRDHRKVFYLLDERVKGHYSNLDNESCLYVNSAFKHRLNFYKISGAKFSQVLTFGNIPPPIKLDAEVYTYFHNVLYLDPVKELTVNSLILKIKILFIFFLAKNTTIWFVQSDLMKEKLAKRFKIDKKRIKVYPIFQDRLSVGRGKMPDSLQIVRYLYVSEGHPYKNHLKLIDAFVKNVKNSKVRKSLTLTVSDKYLNLCSFIDKLRNEGVNIINLGIIPKDDLAIEYRRADIALYPSLSESFGLGLIEAAQYQLPIIAADLSYVHEVVEPSGVFDPNSVDDICRMFSESEKLIGRSAKLKVKNGLNTMINTIFEENESDFQ